MELSPAEQKLQAEGATYVEIDSRYASFQVMPRPDEANDANFPPNMSAVLQLFMMARKKDSFDKCKAIMDSQISVLQAGPDPKAQYKLGMACVCFECGQTGLPVNAADCESDKNTYKASPVCSGCGASQHTNFVRVSRPDGSVIPWIDKQAAR